MAKKTPVQFIIEALDRSTPVLRAMTVQAHRTAQAMEKVTKHGAFAQLKGFGKALGVDRLGSALSNVGDAAGTVARRFGAVAAIAGVAFIGLIRSTEAAGSRLQDVSQRVGQTVDGFASLEYAAKKGGVGSEEFAAGMAHLNKNLGEMKVGKGGGPLLQLLNQVAPALGRQIKAAKSSDQALSLLTDAFARIEDPAKRAVLAQAAFGKSGQQMGSWLHEGRGNLQAMQAEFIRLAGSQEKFAAGAGALGDNFDAFEVALTGVRNQLGGAVFGAVGKVVARLTELIVSKRANIVAWAERAAAAIERWVAGGGLERLIDFLGKMASAVGTVIDFLGPMGTMMAAAAVTAAPLIVAVGSLAGAFVSFGVTAVPALAAFAPAAWAAVAPLLPFIAAGASLAYLGKTIHDNWDDLAFIFEDWGNTLRWSVLDAWEAVRPIIEKLSAFFGGTGVGLGFKGALTVGDSLRERLTPAAAAAAAPRALSSESRVTVDFSNAPRGTRISSDSSGPQPLDVNVGYSMAGN